MPLVRCNAKLLYFAHIPKCGGSSVEDYLRDRFRAVGFYDPNMHRTPPARRWSRTSPQHVDWASLQRLLPAELLDEVFAVVRHPVSRIVSGYHFQVEVEKAVAPDTSFSDWLAAQARAFEADPFTIDNHFRPQVDFIPESGCRVFHLEHGLEAIIAYLDGVVGDEDGPRFMRHNNKRDGKRARQAAPAVPSVADLRLIRSLYSDDFARFGYTLEHDLPSGAASEVPEAILAASRAHRRANTPLNRLASRVRRGLLPIRPR
jgi:hypothetical protein